MRKSLYLELEKNMMAEQQVEVAIKTYERLTPEECELDPRYCNLINLRMYIKDDYKNIMNSIRSADFATGMHYKLGAIKDSIEQVMLYYETQISSIETCSDNNTKD
jgi:hypothetical protein